MSEMDREPPPKPPAQAQSKSLDKSPSQSAREARLAQALRANLRRRKAAAADGKVEE